MGTLVQRKRKCAQSHRQQHVLQVAVTDGQQERDDTVTSAALDVRVHDLQQMTGSAYLPI